MGYAHQVPLGPRQPLRLPGVELAVGVQVDVDCDPLQARRAGVRHAIAPLRAFDRAEAQQPAVFQSLPQRAAGVERSGCPTRCSAVQGLLPADRRRSRARTLESRPTGSSIRWGGTRRNAFYDRR